MISKLFPFLIFLGIVALFFTGIKDMKKKSIMRGIKEIAWSMGIVLLVNWLFFQLSVIPTGSMLPTILEGDVVLVSKLHYGAMTPSTLLHVPFTREKLPFLNIPSYLKWLQLPVYRLPGFSTPKRGDCVVIQQPRTAAVPGIPPDVQVPFLKRIVGGPGDKLSIVDGEVYLDGKVAERFGEYQYKYVLQTRERLNEGFFKRYKIVKYYYLAEGGVVVYTTEAIAEELRRISGIREVKRVIKKRGLATGRLAFAHFAGGNEDQLPAFTIPYEGMEVVLNKKELILYLDVIRECEANRGVEVQVREGKVWIGGEKVDRYRFKEDCYFLLGVNWNDSYDSRGFGLVPKSNIRGKAIMVLLSGKKPKWHIIQNLLTGNIRWGRFGKIIR